ncbi:MAG: hypothetical protein A2048_02610 [Deltaproteobacteria bacterium GWA2_45_12]|nr:MAG: hypothetical protein A2048_02610 [Deltaproteobacteria bacterium GWA2_45_12]
MKAYKTYRIFIFSLALFCVVTALATEVLNNLHFKVQGEIFPFFSWSLFSRVPNLKEDYGIKINSIDGQDIGSVWFQDAESHFKKAHVIDAYVTIKKMGLAFENGDGEKLKELQGFFETYYLEGKKVNYTLEKRSFYPLKRFKTGEFESEKPLFSSSLLTNQN